MSPGFLLAGMLLALYCVLGPIIILALYTLFDKLGQAPEDERRALLPKNKTRTDPFLWKENDVRKYLNGH